MAFLLLLARGCAIIIAEARACLGRRQTHDSLGENQKVGSSSRKNDDCNERGRGWGGV